MTGVIGKPGIEKFAETNVILVIFSFFYVFLVITKFLARELIFNAKIKLQGKQLDSGFLRRGNSALEFWKNSMLENIRKKTLSKAKILSSHYLRLEKTEVLFC